jgi:hypothetical protein
VSKQLSVSAAFAVIAMAMFALVAEPIAQHASENSAPTVADAPHFEISLGGL